MNHVSAILQAFIFVQQSMEKKGYVAARDFFEMKWNEWAAILDAQGWMLMVQWKPAAWSCDIWWYSMDNIKGISLCAWVCFEALK